ncbi:NgoBV family restriction endonuclease [Paenibacillus yanchengensis]|uniref:NgoBV family restriction endonuclease n=1 Tax=Paenibacillus yanchengensis TaxID=2035833 RepID=A0ABW4YHT9_9BACL
MKKKKLNSLEDVFDFAINNIKDQMGHITIAIGGIPKISSSNDIIGNCIQEWIPQWLEDNGLEMIANPNSQQFPDFIATLDGKEYAMEVKCWNGENSPAFDLANFDGFYRAVYDNPEMLNAKYLIFSYKPTTHGFQITNIFLKNVWEITKASKNYPIGLQVKQGSPYAIRPFPFHKHPSTSFSSRREFVEAIQSTREMFPLDNMIDPIEWLINIEERFEILTGEIL